LPLLVLMLGIVRAEHQLAHSRRWSFEITGYDPRDLLRGHYLNYRLKLDEGPALERCDDNSGGRCCLCLRTSGSAQPPKVRRASCALATQRCDGVLQTRYLAQLQRYYIPERSADALTRRLQKAASERRALLVLAIDPTGHPTVDALLVDGQPIEATVPAR
jgi:hypothetical protein